jgi:hypothetical protein
MIWEIVKQILKDNPNRQSYKQIASTLGVCTTTIFRWAEDPHGSGVKFPSDRIITFSDITGDDRLLRYFANECGYLLIRMPDIHSRSVKGLTKTLSKTMKKFAEFLHDTAEALSDGVLTKKEIESVDNIVVQLIEQIFLFKEAISNGH